MKMLNICDYTLGLDIGISSIGWALLDFQNEKIIRVGVRKFQEPVESPASTRRDNRSLRRLIRRRAKRQQRLMHELCKQNIISQEEMMLSLENKPVPSNIFYSTGENHLASPWQLRAEGLERRLTEKEWARVLIHLSKHRGYQSNAIEKKRESGKKTGAGKLLTGLGEMQKTLEAFIRENPGKPHSVGEMIYKKFPHKKRNTTGVYSLTVGREDLLQELETLFEQQRALGNPHTEDDFKERVRGIINSRRSFAKGPGEPSPYGGNLIERMVGKCTLDGDEKRAPKHSYTATMFRVHQTLNNMRWGTQAHQNNILSPEQKQSILDKAQSASKLSYAQIRKLIGLKEGEYFKGILYQISDSQIRSVIYKSDDKDKEYYNAHIKGKKNVIPIISAIINWEMPGTSKEKVKQLEEEFSMPVKIAEKLVKLSKDPESKVLFDFSNLRGLEKTLKDNRQEYTAEDLDEIVRILSIYKEEEACRKLEEYQYSRALSEELALNSFSQFVHLSLATMRKLIPHLEQGKSYDAACREEGFEHTQFKLDRNAVKNPSVYRAFKQTQKLMNALRREHGLPSKIYMEVARDLSRSKEERNKIRKEMDGNEKLRNHLLEEFKAGIGREPVGREAQVWKFYNEQNGKCLYCGESLGDPGSIFAHRGAPLAEVEHTLPYSRSLDNRQCNKTAACTSCNREKGNRTPFEYFGSDERSVAWRNFKHHCSIIKHKDRQKYDILVDTEWDEETSSQRLISDTRYITRLVQNWLESDKQFSGYYVATPKKNQQRNVYAIKGGATAIIRRVWGLERLKYNDEHVRESEKNHALDAAVIAAATNRFIQIISQMNRRKEIYLEKGCFWLSCGKSNNVLNFQHERKS